MQAHGHPHKQAVAAALHTAYDGGEMHSTTAMTQKEVNERNERFWNGVDGNLGPAASEASAPTLAGTKVAVYNPHAHDEVSPTQSDPPDTRSDNLLEGPGAEMTKDDLVEGSEAMETGEHQTDGVVSGYKAGRAAGEELTEGRVPGVDAA